MLIIVTFIHFIANVTRKFFNVVYSQLITAITIREKIPNKFFYRLAIIFMITSIQNARFILFITSKQPG